MWTIDYARPQTWVRTDSAYFLQSPNLPSPMGMFLSSFGSREDVERVKEKHTGRIVDWNQVLGLVETAKRARMEN
jgi:copper chaperone NosL